MSKFYNFKNNLNLISLISLSIFLFFWDIYLFDPYYKAKYLIILLIPFYLNKLFLFNSKYIFFILIIIFIHKFITGYIYDFKYENIDYIKLVYLFTFVIFCSYSTNLFIKNYETIIFYVLIFFLSSYIIFISFYNIENKFILSCYNGFISRHDFLFRENSHFGFTFIGIFFYCIFQIFYRKNLNFKKIIYIISAILIYINYSTSFLAVTVIISFILTIYFLKVNKNFYPFLIILTISSLTLVVDKQCNDRLFSALVSFQDSFFDKFDSDKKNELSKKVLKDVIHKNLELTVIINTDNNIENYSNSSVVYLNSFLVLKEIVSKYPFGSGFDNLGKIYKDQTQNTKLKFNKKYWNDIQNLNLYDGTNNFVKFLGEFGLLGIFLFYYIFKFIFNNNINLDLKILIIAPFIAQLIFRGAGYFNGGFIFYSIIIIFYNYYNYKNIKN